MGGWRKFSDMAIDKSLITEKRLAELRAAREKYRKEKFASLAPVMGDGAVEELSRLYSMFTEDMLIWLADLWDAESGGFYFSNSARDNEGFLPDLESTYQAVRFVAAQCCELDHDENSILAFPDPLRSKISDFAYRLQDEDGFFYHPQWGKKITATRKGRDMAAARRLVEPVRPMKYIHPYKRTSPDGKPASLPEHLQSIEAFRAWMESRSLATHSYQIGNFIDSTSSAIQTAGPEFVGELVEWLNKNNRPDNGLWGEEVNYNSVNGLMKIGLNYSGFGAELPYPDKSFESARFAIMSDEPVTFACEFYNAWAALSSVLTNMDGTGNKKKAEKLRRELRDNSATMIRKTAEKMALTAVGDGSFAYFTAASGKTCPTSQGALVARDDVREGDINGNGCSTSAPLRHMFMAFGVEAVPMFCPEDGKFFFELLMSKLPQKD